VRGVPVKSAVDLLRAVVDAEDAGLQLAMTSVEAMLEAKVWLTENQGVAA
jgi:hypothetical protein